MWGRVAAGGTHSARNWMLSAHVFYDKQETERVSGKG